MIKTAYVQCSPTSVSYANIIHIQQAAKQSGAKRMILCSWDAAAFEDPSFFARSDGRRTRMEQIQENTRIHERILEGLGIEVATIYLSEAWTRLFSKPQLGRAFNAILSKSKISEFAKKAGLPGEDITLSRINYTIADAVICANLEKIFPEVCASPPSEYITSRRLMPFASAIKEVIEESCGTKMPQITYVQPFPFMTDHQGMAPSIEMSEERIRAIIDHAKKNRGLSELETKKIMNLMDVSGHEKDLPKAMHKWFTSIRKNIEKPIESKKSIKITNPEQFHRSIRPLSSIKLRIMSLCDGTRTRYHIARALGIKPVTASVYIGRLRRLGLITDGRRPSRTVSTIVVDLEAMKPENQFTA